MTRDYSQFLPKSAARPGLSPSQMQALGWQGFFAQQTSADELNTLPPVRVFDVNRSGLHVIGEGLDTELPPRSDATVGDWLLYDAEQPASSRLLERKSLIKRRAPGHDRSVQLIAANIDTGFVVTSCNDDFNIARLERYIALVMEAQITPVILLTKSDLVTDAERFVHEAQQISEVVEVIALNAKSEAPARQLAPWCKPGATVAFLGSSGVGKSTLTNALAGDQAIATQAVRETDAKGRHTTTRRQLHAVAGGALVLDTPGMREVQMTDAAAGIGDLFSDLSALETQCKFRDCAHQTEPGCAITAAIASGQIDADRVARWRKLVAEDAFNAATLAQKRTKDKAFGKMVRSAISQKPRNTKGR